MLSRATDPLALPIFFISFTNECLIWKFASSCSSRWCFDVVDAREAAEEQVDDNDRPQLVKFGINDFSLPI